MELLATSATAPKQQRHRHQHQTIYPAVIPSYETHTPSDHHRWNKYKRLCAGGYERAGEESYLCVCERVCVHAKQTEARSHQINKSIHTPR